METTVGAIDRSIRVRGPTVDEVLQHSTAPCLLQLIRLHGYDVWLSDDRQRIEYDDSIPVWLANAIAIYGAEIPDLPGRRELADLRLCTARPEERSRARQ